MSHHRAKSSSWLRLGTGVLVLGTLLVFATGVALAQTYTPPPVATATPMATATPTATPSPTATPTPPASLTLGSGTAASLGSFLTGPNGFTLYTLSSDPTNGSICTGACLGFWPPLLIASGGSVTGPASATGPFGTFARTDTGGTQVTYMGRALYYFKNDTAAGQTNGEGIKLGSGVWHVAFVSGSAPATSTPAAPATPAATSTPPATSSLPADSGSGSGTLLMVLLALGAIVAGAFVLTPMRGRVRRR